MVSMADLKGVGFPVDVNKIQLADLLTNRYPEFQWDPALLVTYIFAVLSL